MECGLLLDILTRFSLPREYLEQIHSGNIVIREISTGHIHRTYHVFDSSSSPISPSYILQQMNHCVFSHPPDLISNLLKITHHLRQKSIPTIELIPLQDTTSTTLLYPPPPPQPPQSFYHQDLHGSYWRMFSYIPNSTVLSCSSPSLHEISLVANAYGNFQSSLSDLCPSSLTITIPNFHNTKVYYQNFLDAMAADPCHRIEKYSLHSEIHSVCSSLRSQRLLEIIPSLHESFGVPYRVVHYDTKVDNILFDLTTRQPICVIDLDTVMFGSLLFDFGDMVRSLCTTAASEDEADLEKISLNLMKFQAIVDGYLTSDISSTQAQMSASNFTKPITEIEIDHLVIAAQVIPLLSLLPPHLSGIQVVTYEQAIRFLTDFILGDIYFKISPQDQQQDEGKQEGERHQDCLQNLSRARNQFQLLLSMESQEGEMRDIVNRVWKHHRQDSNGIGGTHTQSVSPPSGSLT